MIFGLNVSDPSGYAAIRIVEVGWAQPPPPGSEWACCRRGDVACAEVAGACWCGVDDEPDVWLSLTGPRALVDHLINWHRFDQFQR